MTTGFICDRCGTRWGVLLAVQTQPDRTRRHELMAACAEGRCDVWHMRAKAMVRWAARHMTVV